MVKVNSLSLRIVLQFAVILLPLVAVLVYGTGAEARRAAGMSHALALHENAIDAKEHYALFLSGAADAVDTGRLSAPALAAFNRASAGVERLSELDPVTATALVETRQGLQGVNAGLSRDSSLAGLLRLRGAMTLAKTQLEQAAAAAETNVDKVVAYSIQDTARTQQLVLVLSAVLLVVTLVFIVNMVRGLSRPLRIAVDLADRIAAGRKFEFFSVDPKHDIGNLLGSLQRMHLSLRGFENDVERQRAGLEHKVRQLAQSEHSLAQAQRTAKLGNWQWEAGGAASWSDEMYRILGLSRGDRPPTLRSFLRAIPTQGRSAWRAHFTNLSQRADELAVEHRVCNPNGDERVVHHLMAAERDLTGRLLRLYGTLQDITDRQRAEEKMRRMALYDSLTGLANRQFFNEHLNNAVAHSKRHGGGLATLFIDLDRFKRINDTLGHAVGDAVLCQAATRLLGCVRESDAVAPAKVDSDSMVARLGGDEFIVLLREVLAPRDAVLVAGRMIKALAAPFFVDGHELVVTASIGIAMHPSDGDDAEALVKAADAAMYAAKNLGRNTFQFFTEEMNTIAFEKLSLEGELRRAIENRQFVLHFQPKVDISTGSILGVEALIRWNHPLWGMVAPGKFIGLAEELGLISAIGDWVLEDSCRQAAQWRRAGLGEVSIAVNLASPSFRKPRLVQELAALIEHHALTPGQLQIEATESMLMESAGATLQTLKDLHELGVKLAIDDFGTGYSSLSYLRRFPVDQLKIDRSFVSEMTHNADDAAIVGAIISLGRNMKREIVAEGVETIAQARLLRELGCDVMQGFLFSRPVSAEQMEALLRRDRPFAWASADTALEPA